METFEIVDVNEHVTGGWRVDVSVLVRISCLISINTLGILQWAIPIVILDPVFALYQ